MDIRIEEILPNAQYRVTLPECDAVTVAARNPNQAIMAARQLALLQQAAGDSVYNKHNGTLEKINVTP